MGAGALSGLKVIELGNLVSAPFCAKLLASLGAEVIKIEKPGIGDDARRVGPFPGDIPHPEGSGLFLYLNTDKLGVSLNLDTNSGLNILHSLVKEADILIENNPLHESERLGISYDELKTINPQLVVTSISAFGRTGPYREYKGTDLIGYHAGGLGYITPRPGAGQPDEGPLRVKGHLADFIAGLDAATGTLCALFNRELTGLGQYLDISEQESVAMTVATLLTSDSYEGETYGRVGAARYQPVATMACKDGFVDIQCMTESHWQNLVQLMGNPDWAESDLFKDLLTRGENWDALEPLISEWLAEQPKQEFFREAQIMGIPSAPVNTTEDLVKSEHLAVRQFFVETDHPVAGRVKYPGSILRLSETPAKSARRAPLLGEHNELIYCGRLGYSRQDLVDLRRTGVI